MEELAGRAVIAFSSQSAWEKWLDQNHTKSEGIWLKIAKKASGVPTLSYDQAVETGLCYGWIDGQKRAYDNGYWLQGFTPRRPRSVWSKVNVERIGQLSKAGRMKPAGLKQVEAAKADGRWEAAYHPQSTATMPEDFLMALERNAKAKAAFASLNSTNRYAMFYRIQDAKRPATRMARIEKFVTMLAEGRKLY